MCAAENVGHGLLTEKQIIKSLLRDRPVAYRPDIAKALKSTDAGILVCQFLYWSGKQADPEGWIYKSRDEIYDETGLTRRNLETARSIATDHEVPVLEYRLFRQRSEYRILFDNLVELLRLWYESAQSLVQTVPIGRAGSAQHVGTDPPDRRAGSALPSLTEITSEITSETTHRMLVQRLGEHNATCGTTYTLGNISHLVETIKSKNSVTDAEVAELIHRYTQAKFSSGIRKNLGKLLANPQKYLAYLPAKAPELPPFYLQEQIDRLILHYEADGVTYFLATGEVDKPRIIKFFADKGEKIKIFSKGMAS